MSYRPELEELASAATKLVAALPGGDRPPAGGSLTVVGTGIMAVHQLTVEAVAEMAAAEALLHVIGEPMQEDVLAMINPAAETLTGYYADDTDRGQTYEAMIQHILGEVVAGKRTVAAFYGHPGVFVYPTHEAVRRARVMGFPARMLPGVSAEDCLVADLGIDPGDGCHSFEATDFLARRRRPDTSVHLLVWQIGALGDLSGGAAGYDPHTFMLLVRKLVAAYGPGHPVTVYEAPFAPNGRPTVQTVSIGDLPYTPMSLASTLYVPPAHALPNAWGIPA